MKRLHCFGVEVRNVTQGNAYIVDLYEVYAQRICGLVVWQLAYIEQMGGSIPPRSIGAAKVTDQGESVEGI